MTLARRILVERRALVVPVVLLAVLDAGLYALAVYPLSLRVRTLAERSASASRQRDAAEREYADAKALAAGRDHTSAELQAFYRDVLPEDLAGARRITYARLAQMARESNLTYDHRSSDTDQSYKGALRKLQITMVLEGKYRDVRDFVHRLETSNEFVVIDGMALAERPQNESGVRLTLDLATYYRPEPHAD